MFDFLKKPKEKVETNYVNPKLVSFKYKVDNWLDEYNVMYSTRMVLINDKINELSEELKIDSEQIRNYIWSAKIPLTKAMIRNNKLKRIKK